MEPQSRRSCLFLWMILIGYFSLISSLSFPFFSSISSSFFFSPLSSLSSSSLSHSSSSPSPSSSRSISSLISSSQSIRSSSPLSPSLFSISSIESLTKSTEIVILSMKLLSKENLWSFLDHIWNEEERENLIGFYGIGLLDKQKFLRRIGVASLVYQNSSVTTCYYVSHAKGDEPSTFGIAIGCRFPPDLFELVQKESLTLELHYLQMENQTYLDFLKHPPVYSSLLSTSLFHTNLHASTRNQSPFNVSALDLPSPLSQVPYHENGICTVQVFSNQLTGPRLYFFSLYYLQLGWHVMIYDRYGRHESYLRDLFSYPTFHYHPFTVLQLLFPHIYNLDAARKEDTSLKYYFKRDSANASSTIMATIETSNQNSDKQKTYDYCRIEYSNLSSILFLDADEIFHCDPSGKRDKKEKGKRVRSYPSPDLLEHSQDIQTFLKYVQESNYEEVSVKRYNVFSLLWKSAHENVTVKTSNNSSSLLIDASSVLSSCLLSAYEKRSLNNMFNCWSSQIKSGPNPKPIDIGTKCPFHWNHMSCKIQMMKSKEEIEDHSKTQSQTKSVVPEYQDYMYRCPCRILDLSSTSSPLTINRQTKLKCGISHFAKYFHSNQGRTPQDIFNHTKLFDRYRTAASKSSN